MRIASLTLLCLALMLPASAQVLYEDGPVNGTQDAWTINFGYIVSDSLTLNGNSVSGFAFYAWEFPGDVLSSVDWSITGWWDTTALSSPTRQAISTARLMQVAHKEMVLSIS